MSIRIYTTQLIKSGITVISVKAAVEHIDATCANAQLECIRVNKVGADARLYPYDITLTQIENHFAAMRDFIALAFASEYNKPTNVFTQKYSASVFIHAINPVLTPLSLAPLQHSPTVVIAPIIGVPIDQTLMLAALKNNHFPV
jgi:hypothetical protein